MEQKKFSKKEAIIFGWNTTKKNFGFFAVILLAIFLLNFLPTFLLPAFVNDSAVLSFIASLVLSVAQMIINIGLITVSIRFVEGKTNTFKDLFTHIPIVAYILAGIAYGAIVVVGTLLLIIPGIIWSIKYGFYPYLVVDKRLGPIASIKKSGEITKGAKWDLLLFGLLLGLINLGGALLFLIGLFATIPTTMLAMAFVYRKLLSPKLL